MAADANGRSYVGFVAAVLGAVIGGGGSSYVFVTQISPEILATLARPDPFTGTQARELERKIDEVGEDLEYLERRVDQLPPRDLTQSVALLERELQYLKHEIERHQEEHNR